MYLTLKFLHILGVILLLGNVTVSAVWKVFANRTGHPLTIAFAQRLITYTDWTLTLAGIGLIALGGYGMVYTAGLDVSSGWLLAGQLLFAASGLIWGAILLPIQIAQARMAELFDLQGSIGHSYWLLSRRWIVWGVLATIPLVVATFVMVVKS